MKNKFYIVFICISILTLVLFYSGTNQQASANETVKKVDVQVDKSVLREKIYYNNVDNINELKKNDYTFERETDVELSGIDLINGYSKSKELYDKNNRMKKIKIEFSDNVTYEFDLKDNVTDYQTIDFGKKIKTKKVKIYIDEVYKGDTFDDTCLSEVRFF